MTENDKKEEQPTVWKNLSVKEEVHDRISKWAEVQRRTLGGQVEIMLEVYEGKLKPKD